MTALIAIASLWLVGLILGISALAAETAEHTVPVSLPRLIWPHWSAAIVTVPVFGWVKFANGGVK